MDFATIKLQYEVNKLINVSKLKFSFNNRFQININYTDFCNIIFLTTMIQRYILKTYKHYKFAFEIYANVVLIILLNIYLINLSYSLLVQDYNI